MAFAVTNLTASVICVGVVCLIFITSSCSIRPNSALTLSSSSPDASSSLLAFQASEADRPTSEQARAHFRKLLLFSDPDRKSPDGEEVDNVNAWLRPDKQVVPLALPVNSGNYDLDAAIEYHLGGFVGAPAPSPKQGKTANPSTGPHVNLFGDKIFQPPPPPRNTGAYDLYSAASFALIQYEHKEYYSAWIKLAHPPPLYEARKSSQLPYWNPHTEASITSLLYHAGVPAMELFQLMSFQLKEDHTRPALRDIIQAVSKEDLSSVNVDARVTQSTHQTKTYAQAFDKVWANFVTTEIQRDQQQTYIESAREFAEFLRMFVFLVPSETMYSHTLPMLYSLPVLPQFHPRQLLQFLHQYIKLAAARHPQGGREPLENDFETWLQQERPLESSGVKSPEHKVVEKVATSTLRHSRPIRKSLAALIEMYAPEGQKWQGTPFKDDNRAPQPHVLGSFWDAGPVNSGCMRPLLAFVTFSHTLLWLRSQTPKRPRPTITSMFKEVSSQDSKLASEIAIIEVDVENVVVSALIAVTYLTDPLFKPNPYKDIDIQFLLKNVGGVISQKALPRIQKKLGRTDVTVFDPKPKQEPAKTTGAEEAGGVGAGPSTSKKSRTDESN